MIRNCKGKVQEGDDEHIKKICEKCGSSTEPEKEVRLEK